MYILNGRTVYNGLSIPPTPPPQPPLICGQTLSTKSNLNRHKLYHESPQFTYMDCRKKSTQNVVKEAHNQPCRRHTTHMFCLWGEVCQCVQSPSPRRKHASSTEEHSMQCMRKIIPQKRKLVCPCLLPIVVRNDANVPFVTRALV